MKWKFFALISRTQPEASTKAKLKLNAGELDKSRESQRERVRSPALPQCEEEQRNLIEGPNCINLIYQFDSQSR